MKKPRNDLAATFIVRQKNRAEIKSQRDENHLKSVQNTRTDIKKKKIQHIDKKTTFKFIYFTQYNTLQAEDI